MREIWGQGTRHPLDKGNEGSANEWNGSCRRVAGVTAGVKRSDVWLCVIDGTYRGIHPEKRFVQRKVLYLFSKMFFCVLYDLYGSNEDQ